MALRLLTIGHSYAVALNRRLADAMAKAQKGRWEVTAVAPKVMQGDLRPVCLEPLLNESCKVVALPVRFSRRLHTMSYRGLRPIMRSTPWDVVHIWQEPYTLPGWQAAYIAPRNAKVVFSTFQNISKNYPPPFSWMERSVLQRSAGWIAYGETIKAALAKRVGYAEKPCQVIPVGVDTDAFRPDPERGASILRSLGWGSREIPVVGFLGRFIPEKGLSLLMRALERIDVPWRALIVGGGPMEKELRSWAVRHDSNVRIVTGVPHDQVPAHLNAMDMLVAPSQTTNVWREQLGRMLLEAFASGVAVIGSDSGEIPHVIGTSGLIVPERSQDQWVSTIRTVIADREYRSRLAGQGREAALKRFSWQVVANSHLEFFESLLTK